MNFREYTRQIEASYFKRYTELCQCVFAQRNESFGWEEERIVFDEEAAGADVYCHTGNPRRLLYVRLCGGGSGGIFQLFKPKANAARAKTYYHAAALKVRGEGAEA